MSSKHNERSTSSCHVSLSPISSGLVCGCNGRNSGYVIDFKYPDKDFIKISPRNLRRRGINLQKYFARSSVRTVKMLVNNLGDRNTLAEFAIEFRLVYPRVCSSVRKYVIPPPYHNYSITPSNASNVDKH